MDKKISLLHQEYMQECRYSSRVAEKTLTGYKAVFILLLKIFPNLSLKMIDPKIMTEFFKRLDKRKRIVGRGIEKTGIKPSTVASYWCRLNRFFEWLRIKGHIDKNPFKEMHYPVVRYENRKFLSKETVEKIFTAVSFNINWESDFIRKRNTAILFTFLYTGIRKGELLGLTMFGVDLDTGFLEIRGDTSKSGKSRIVPVNSKLVASLKDYLRVRKEIKCTTPSLFVSSNHDAGIKETALKYMLKKIATASGVRFHVHQLRHTFAVNLVNNKTDVTKVKQLLGHKSIVSTMLYTRCIPPTSMKADLEALTLDSLL